MMLEKYPNKGNLNVVLLPLAKEVLSHYGNIPLKVKDLEKQCQAYKEKYGFKGFNLSHLKNDDLWYLR